MYRSAKRAHRWAGVTLVAALVSIAFALLAAILRG